jgi:hypothetical protein
MVNLSAGIGVAEFFRAKRIPRCVTAPTIADGL